MDDEVKKVNGLNELIPNLKERCNCEIKWSGLLLMILLSFLNFTSGFSQAEVVDGLQPKLYPHSPRDTTHVAGLLEEATRHRKSEQFDSCIFFAKKAMAYMGDYELSTHRIKALEHLGSSYMRTGDYIKAQRYLNKVPFEATPENPAIQEIQANVLNNKGIITSFFGNSDSAIYYFQESKKIYAKQGSHSDLTKVLVNIGKMYMHKGNYAVAVKHFFEAYGHSAENTEVRAILDLNLGECYAHLKEYTKAKYYAWQALTYFKADGSSAVGMTLSHLALANSYLNLGVSDSTVYQIEQAIAVAQRSNNQGLLAKGHYYLSLHHKRLGNWEEAAEQAEIAYLIFKDESAQKSVVMAMFVIAEAHFQLGRTGEAFRYTRKGLNLSRELKVKDAEKDFLKLLAGLYASLNHYSEAYRYRMAYSDVKDSVLNEEKTRQIANMEALYESEKKEQALALAEAQQAATMARLEEKTHREWFLISGLVLSIGVLSLGGFLFHIQRKNKKTVEIQNARLESLNQTKNRFFTIIGHDLRRPITSFAGINDLITWYIEKNELSKIKALSQDITQSVRQLDTLLNNLLNWSMSQTVGIPYHPEAIRLKELTTEINQLFTNLLKAKQIELKDSTSDDLWVYADKNALLMVLRNLVSNALKFTPSEGIIEITARIRQHEVLVEIKDSGVGIPAEKLANIFEMHDDKSTFGTDNEKGTGLGLLLCKEYITLNKGTIDVKSTINVGSTFGFTIPRFEPKGRPIAATHKKQVRTAETLETSGQSG